MLWQGTKLLYAMETQSRASLCCRGSRWNNLYTSLCPKKYHVREYVRTHTLFSYECSHARPRARMNVSDTLRLRAHVRYYYWSVKLMAMHFSVSGTAFRCAPLLSARANSRVALMGVLVHSVRVCQCRLTT